MKDGKHSKRKTHLFFLFFVVLLLSSFPSASAETGLEAGEVHIPVFLIIVGLAVLLFLGGLTFDESGFLILGSMVLFFMAGFIIQSGSLYVHNGDTYTVYGNNFSYENGTPTYHWDYDGTTIPNKIEDAVYPFHEVKEYEAWTGRNAFLVGWLLMILSFIVFALTLYYLGTGED